MNSTAKKNAVLDDDVICLSSDAEDNSQMDSCYAESSTSAESTKEKGMVNGSSHRKSPSLFDKGFSTVSSAGSSASSGTMVNGNGRQTGPSSSCKLKTESCVGAPVVNLDDEDSEEFEIEYQSQGSSGKEGSGGAQTGIKNESDDDDIQVLEENVNRRSVAMIRSRKRPYQDSQNQTKEVNLSVPKVLGLTPGNYTQPRDKITVTTRESRDSRKLNSEEGENIVQEIEKVDAEPMDQDVVEVDSDNCDLKKTVEVGSSSGKQSLGNPDYAEQSKNKLDRFINEFCARRTERKEKLAKAKLKMLEAYDNIKHFHYPIHKRLIAQIEDACEVIRGASEEHWKTFKELKEYMNPENLTKDLEKTDQQIDEEREHQKTQLRMKYEKQLGKIRRKIVKLEQADVDWDDDNEHNSAYILTSKYKEKLIKAYYTLCDISKCNRFTGRPTQTKINLRKHNGGSGHEEIDSEVEHFINKQGFLFAPDYTDILELIQRVNRNKCLGLTEENILQIAQKMFESVIKIIRKRRQKEFKVNMLEHLPKTSSPSAGRSPTQASPPPTDIAADDDNEDTMEERFQDPAEQDAELNAKLEENVKLRKSESEVVERFVKLAQEKGHLAVAVEGDNINNSPPASDNDEEDDDDEDEEDEENKTISNQYQQAELTEDEDEEPETVGVRGQGWPDNSPVPSAAEDDDTSNDGKTTTESDEVDTDLDNILEEGGVVSSDHHVAAPTTQEAGIEAKTSVHVDRASAVDSKQVVHVAGMGVDADVEPPPAKRMRADENCNEAATKDSSTVDLAIAPPNAMSETSVVNMASTTIV